METSDQLNYFEVQILNSYNKWERVSKFETLSQAIKFAKKLDDSEDKLRIVKIIKTQITVKGLEWNTKQN